MIEYDGWVTIYGIQSNVHDHWEELLQALTEVAQKPIDPKEKVFVIDSFSGRHQSEVSINQKKLVKDDSNPSSAAFWEKVKKIAAEARKEPQWAKAGINLNPENYEVF